VPLDDLPRRRHPVARRQLAGGDPVGDLAGDPAVRRFHTTSLN
jgi:hypothetical protein